ncbi:MAG: signal recognition particle receptor subunit alpha [Euryarchaeota archaeon]|nr:signal recognition particle receptor subunit alpha [Euryarchaeota archaeon]MDE1836103.1 signal recognition particle receptor subunit alpha [Euryarchaeota archaeon]MDE1879393.1 signal recognition particle receptor subunit alpha [Euryarchaeota archaeon]MDE2044081.1 signal recognition particle receptor subunit alpha [Thermoplasmata archaeon]
MVLDSLGKSLRNVLAKIAKSGAVDEELLAEVSRDIQRALLQSDVNVQLALELTTRVKTRAKEEKPPAGASLRDFLVRIVYEEIRRIMGEDRVFEMRPRRIMLVGLFGQGKTTTAAKLARLFQKKGVRAALIAADVHRPAAIDQLEQLAKKVNASFYANREEKRAEVIATQGREKFPATDVMILDTAGRSNLDAELVAEIQRCKKTFDPQEVLLVLDAAMGQSAGRSAEAFHKAVGLTGVILTKLDGSAKGGGALSAVARSGAPILFVGVGEHAEDLEKFDPTRFVSQLLGMGDIQTLLERFETLEGKEEAEKAAESLLTGKFTLKEFYVQLDSLGKMGPFTKLKSLIPGLAQAKIDDAQVEETQTRLAAFKVIMDSMTKEEMTNPQLIKGDRVQRIARGSGHRPQEVRALLKYYEQTKRAAHGIASNRKLRRHMERQLAASGGPKPS